MIVLAESILEGLFLSVKIDSKGRSVSKINSNPCFDQFPKLAETAKSRLGRPWALTLCVSEGEQKSLISCNEWHGPGMQHSPIWYLPGLFIARTDTRIKTETQVLHFISAKLQKLLNKASNKSESESKDMTKEWVWRIHRKTKHIHEETESIKDRRMFIYDVPIV